MIHLFHSFVREVYFCYIGHRYMKYSKHVSGIFEKVSKQRYCIFYFLCRNWLDTLNKKSLLHKNELGAVARSEACSLGMQAAPSSIPTSGTFFRGDLVMKVFLRPFSLFRWFKKSSCQLLAKDCALTIGKLLNCLGGLPRNSVVRVPDRALNHLKCVEGP